MSDLVVGDIGAVAASVSAAGSCVTKPCCVNGTFHYTLYEFNLPGGPEAAPVGNIYSDAARTVLVHGPITLTATADPNKWVMTYPDSLAAGTYYLIFETELTPGNTFQDVNDCLILEAVSGTVGDAGAICTAWVSETEVRTCCDGFDEDQDLTIYRIAASEMLYALSGRQFPGTCTMMIRPCGPYSCSCRCHSGSTWPVGGCCCPPEIILDPPAEEIVAVGIDGTLLEETHYALQDGGRRLVRMEVDGENEGWMCCQNLSRPTTEEDTFYITYTFGPSIPMAGKLAAQVLSCELAKACLGVDGCQLPQRITSVTRQGVSMVVVDPFQFLENGRLGLAEVDFFLAAINPGAVARRARLMSPDVPRHRT